MRRHTCGTRVVVQLDAEISSRLVHFIIMRHDFLQEARSDVIRPQCGRLHAVWLITSRAGFLEA